MTAALDPATAVRLIALLVLLVLAIESAVLYRFTRGPRFASLVPNLAAGALLVCAVAAATLPSPVLPVAACVLLGGLAHAWDLVRRLSDR